MKRILVIDDSEKTRTILKLFLTAHDYVVDLAVDGRDGIRMFEAVHPDLVITDIMMPEIDGVEVVLALRKTHPDVPLFAISGGMHGASVDFLPMVKNFGVSRVFYKPMVLAELLEAIEEVLGK